MLTLKAVRALQSADVILFNTLVSDDVLDLSRREARRMLVGKRGGKRSCRQEDINALMVKFARDGKRVGWLKSADPMVFGRAGEEAATVPETVHRWRECFNGQGCHWPNPRNGLQPPRRASFSR